MRYIQKEGFVLNPSESVTIEQLVSGDRRLRHALDRLGIACHANGRTPLAPACAGADLDPSTTRRLLLALRRDEDDTPPRAPKELAQHDLVDFLERIDHADVRGQVSRLDAAVCRAAAEFGAEAPELRRLDRLFAELTHALHEHIRCEEQTLFPALRRSDETNRFEADAARLRPVADALAQEHDAHQRRLNTMGRLIHSAQRRKRVCDGLESLYAQVRALRDILKQHGRIEAQRIYTAFGSAV